MPRFPVSPYWSSNPNIPIYLDESDERGKREEQQRSESETVARSEPQPQPHPRHAPEFICPTCETSSRDTPIHCVSVAPSPSPPAYTPRAPSYRQHLAVPTLTIQTPRESWSRPQAPIRTLQLDPEGRPNVRFRRNAFSPLSPTVTDPITPGTAERGEDGEPAIEPASNLAQRIEQKLWNYTASRSVVKRWLIEIISWTLSASCMAGIFIMLMFHKDKRIPTWPLGLTLNAYISVLSKVASGALLLPVSEALGQLKWSWFQGETSKKMWDFEIFDSASRGPWGSFLLLIRTRGKSLAALGAAVTIMSLALDPFFQQVVEYPELWRLQPVQGTIPVAIGYEPFAKGQEYVDKLTNLNPDNTMLGVVARYFYDNGTSPMAFGRGVRAEVPLSCPNSNCTWPEYETLGVNSECAEVTDKLEFRCAWGSLDWVQHPIVDLSGETNYVFPNGTACGWWLKAEKPLLMTGYNTASTGQWANETLIVRSEALYDIFSRKFLPGYEPVFNNSRDPLAHVLIVSGESIDNVRNNGTPIAHECLVQWSVNTILSSYSEGGYSEEITKVQMNRSVTASPWLTNTIKGSTDSWDLYEYYYLEDAYIESDSGTMYHIDNNTHVLTISIFDDAFPSYFTLVNSTQPKDAMLRYKRWKTIQPYTRNVTYNPFQYDNISLHFEHMATAMTNLMRSAGIDTDMVHGEAWDKESIVDVRWVWLSLPISLLAFTGIFLLGTVIRSSREQDRVGVWKTSAIASLFYGLPKDMTQKMEDEKQHGTPRLHAKEVKVKWVPKRGWRFSGNSVSPSSAHNFLAVSPASEKAPSPTSAPKAKQSPPVPPAHWI
ncbi:uncharacterized protein CC84DRAFT_1198567 [Paraphaeosphaeria sporulosa]|uniref:DUF3176 domain-containing protein n=1 Tax=Paraphaeosphaeria sporulosa TaxID=1460663 RepID=A0A177C6X4_9PLEO|nr:uncharacterized protein CC84DRAFT_1198567 [Paraphaeosphaeria sporulosa]OAG02450.1 hypothetical protein CC84DRAFT_1198567 [Paraphaeosphaeria sporulosa]